MYFIKLLITLRFVTPVAGGDGWVTNQAERSRPRSLSVMGFVCSYPGKGGFYPRLCLFVKIHKFGQMGYKNRLAEGVCRGISVQERVD